MRLRKYMITLACCVSVTAMITACDKDFTKGTPFEQNNNGATSQPVSATESPKEDPGTTEATPVPTADPDVTVTSTPTPELTEAVTPTPEETASPEPTETSTPAPTETEAPRDAFDRQEYWKMSFLVWLPYFEGGTFTAQNSEGTYDYATFTNVNEDEVKTYISSLKKSGFTTDSEEKISAGIISFSAYNYNSWNATVSFSGSTLTIGSGFTDKETSDDETLTKLYTTTTLQYIPRFESGTFAGSDSQNDSSMYTYAFYSNVSKDDVSEYIEKLKKAGYIYAVDENYESSSTWYIALNEERFECHLEYDGSSVKIGCGISEDD